MACVLYHVCKRAAQGMCMGTQEVVVASCHGQWPWQRWEKVHVMGAHRDDLEGQVLAGRGLEGLLAGDMAQRPDTACIGSLSGMGIADTAGGLL